MPTRGRGFGGGGFPPNRPPRQHRPTGRPIRASPFRGEHLPDPAAAQPAGTDRRSVPIDGWPRCRSASQARPGGQAQLGRPAAQPRPPKAQLLGADRRQHRPTGRPIRASPFRGEHLPDPAAAQPAGTDRRSVPTKRSAAPTRQGSVPTKRSAAPTEGRCQLMAGLAAARPAKLGQAAKPNLAAQLPRPPKAQLLGADRPRRPHRPKVGAN